MKIKLMKRSLLLAAAAVSLTVVSSEATLTQWQDAITAGPASAATNFVTVSTPVLFNVGTLTGDRAFEFIVNVDSTAALSSALLGTFSAANGNQALKYEQYNNLGTFGMTAFGVADYESTIVSPVAQDTQVVFTFDGTKTDLYVNGAFATTFTGAAALALSGEVGLGGAWSAAAYVDVLPGSIYGFASYDSGLTADQILTHYNAFAAVPEAGSAGLMGLALAGGLMRRQRRA